MEETLEKILDRASQKASEEKIQFICAFIDKPDGIVTYGSGDTVTLMGLASYLGSEIHRQDLAKKAEVQV